MKRESDVDALTALLSDLDNADDEHPDVAVTHKSNWTLSAFASGRVILENVEDDSLDGPLHLGPLARDEILGIMRKVATGAIADLMALPWRDGYG